jgi:hypothetical protein
MAMHASNSIIKFSDDTTVVGLITNNDNTAYREEVRALGVSCQENNLSLNVIKTKEMIVDFRKQQREHPRIHIDRTTVEKVESYKFLGVHITDKLKCSNYTDSDIYNTQCHRKAKKIIKDNNHLSHCLFTPLPSISQGQYRCIKAGTERLKNILCLKDVRLLE